jgi:protein arginine N-methyltransferase 5
VILPPPRNRAHVASYARAVNECLKNTPYVHFSIRIPIYDPSIFHPRPSSISYSVSSPANLLSSTPRIEVEDDQLLATKSPRAPEGELNGTWEMWDIIRSVCDYNPRLTLSEDSLVLTRCNVVDTI